MREDLQKVLDNAKSKNLINPLGIKGQIKMLENQLSADEQVLEINSANANLVTKTENLQIKPFTLTNKKPGIFVITSKRVIHISKVLFNEAFEQIFIKDINNVEYKSSIMFTTLRIQSISNILEVDLKKEEVQNSITIINDLRNSKTQETNSYSNVDIPEQIKKLSELKNQGILTEDEFNKKKKELLDKM